MTSNNFSQVFLNADLLQVVSWSDSLMGLTDSLEYLEEEMMEWKFGKKNLLDARSAMSIVSVPVDNLGEETLQKFRDLCLSKTQSSNQCQYILNYKEVCT